MHIQFPSLEQYASVYARETYAERQERTYGAKIKLHGTNTSVCIFPNGQVECQSRKEVLTLDTDVHGFAATIGTIPEWRNAATTKPILFYGEWAGPGVQKGDAVTRTDKLRYYIFAVGIGVMQHPQNADLTLPEWMITDPETIRGLLPFAENDLIRVLDFEATYTFDYRSDPAVEEALERLNDAVDAIAVCDPYIQRTFGIEAPGEGLVLVPITTAIGQLDGASYGRRCFKAKTEKHRVRKQKKPAERVQETPESLTQFLSFYVTPQRLDQAITETQAQSLDKRHTPAVLAWMVNDVVKEAQADIAALTISDDMLKKAITASARTLWLETIAQANAS